MRLGRELCLAFAEAGWGVIIHYHRSQQAAAALRQDLRARGVPAEQVRADLADPAAVDALLPLLPDDARGGLQCIVHNASAFVEDDGWSYTPDGLQRHLQTNLLAPLRLTQAFALLVRQRAGGAHAPAGEPACVVHILDQKVHNLNPDYFTYTLSKLALERAVGLQAQAYAPWLRVCGVSPGLSYVSGPQTEDNFERARRVNPLRRPLNPADVARTVVHVARTPGLNGCVIPVDNGQHRLGLARDVMFAVDLGLAP
ncbi:Enoyl-acyl-carrier-protein reductase NADPH FabL [Tepidimonas alkaliphilus]|uniref:Enoyl-acyl-carrier-protein reductase NADPH FabL n=1 Tax=Tepidimonas alkaliphilus TaxID=2588942 RepID=A0A554W9B0_9BURK|nr:Enoyl-acyl-carrier-protein reductase NADPH FabL [Tepidimonas alkaliphilus]